MNYDAVNLRDADGVDNESFIQFYKNRPPHLEEVTLFDFAKKFSKGKNNSISVNRTGKIVQIIPKVTNMDSELLFKQKLFLYHHWREEEQLKAENETWFLAYDRQRNGQLQEYQ